MTIFELNLFWLNIAPTYYGLMYAISFFIIYLLIKSRKYFTNKQIDDLFFYLFLWVLLWWRLWYILFYDLSFYLANPLDIFKIWNWWMSFHGWMTWVTLAIYYFSKVRNKNFLKVSDEIVLFVPIGLFFGRIWNYINKELLWFEYYWFLAVELWNKSYFPSTLLEAFLEWIILLIILLFISNRKKYLWQIWVYFLIFYWVFRFLIEFIRTPDPQIGYIFWFITMWQILSLFMIIFWFFLSFYLSKLYKNA